MKRNKMLSDDEYFSTNIINHMNMLFRIASELFKATKLSIIVIFSLTKSFSF